MAKVEFAGDSPHFVPTVGRVVDPGDVIEVADELYESFVPPKEHRSETHPWLGVEAPASTKAAKKSASEKKD